MVQRQDGNCQVFNQLKEIAVAPVLNWSQLVALLFTFRVF